MFDNSLGFSTYNDFFKRRNNIKKQYNNLKKEMQYIYKLYLYAQREMSTNKVDLIWEFLNEPENSCYCPTTEQLEYYFNNELEQIELSHLTGDDSEY